MKKLLSIILVLTLGMAELATADLVFDSGHNTFDDSYPYYGEVWVTKDAILDVMGGSMGKLGLLDNAEANIYEGEILYKIAIQDNTTVNIYGGIFDMFLAGNDSLAYLYAYDVVPHHTGGLADSGWIEGKYYSNDAPFSFSFYNDTSYSHIRIVPEPTALLLLGLGGFFLRNRRR